MLSSTNNVTVANVANATFFTLLYVASDVATGNLTPRYIFLIVLAFTEAKVHTDVVDRDRVPCKVVIDNHLSYFNLKVLHELQHSTASLTSH